MSRNRRFSKKAKIARNRKKHNAYKLQKCKMQIQTMAKNAKEYVINLSTRQINDTELCALAKGLKFVPTTKYIGRNVLRDFCKFERNMRLKYYFHKNGNVKTYNHPFKMKSKFEIPKFADNGVEKYLFYTKLYLSEYIPNQGKNMSLDERKCLSTLRNDPSICIHKADKNNVTVIQNTSDYIEEGERQLNDGIHYEQIENVCIDETMKLIKNLTYEMKNKDEIDDVCLQFLLQEGKPVKIPKAYFLPKIHKLEQNKLKLCQNNEISKEKILVPGRPIIAQCSGPLENIGKFLDYFLLPIVRKQETYLSDTTDFIRKIESIRLENNPILISYDITSLYTNLKFPEIMNSVEKALNSNENIEYDIKRPGTESLMKILHILLTKNEFTFNGKSYKQIIGASMGAIASPEICDVAIYDHIKQIIEDFPFKNNIIFHQRMRDDGFIIFNGTSEQIVNLFEKANEMHDLLKFTFEIDTESMKFLDTEIYKGKRFEQDGILDIKCYNKKTEKFQYLHRNSCHPQKCFKSFVKGEGIRLLRNTSDKNEYKKRINLFVEKLTKRGYKKEQVWKILNNIHHNDRITKLKNKCKNKNKTYKNMFITTYHHNADMLQRILTKFWYFVHKDPTTKNMFKSRPCVAFKRGKNIKDILTVH